MNSIFSRMGAVYRVLRKTFGVKVIPLFVVVLFSVLRTVVGIGMALDNVFFSRLAKARANRPIVLVGNPRTGTTFLQRFMADEGFGSGMELFLMLYPSLILQRCSGRCMPLLEKVSPAKYHSTAAHAHQPLARSKPTTWACSSATSTASSSTASSCRGTTRTCCRSVRPARARHVRARLRLARKALAAEPRASRRRTQRRQALLRGAASAALPRALSRGADPLHGARSARRDPELDEPRHRRARSRVRLLVETRRRAKALARTHVPRVDHAVSQVPRGLDERRDRQEPRLRRALRPHDAGLRRHDGRDVHASSATR